ncbi:MAG: tetratricopeptide repeat protein [Bdellovibrionota bacterium]
MAKPNSLHFLLLFPLFVAACSGRKVDQSLPAEETDQQRIENLTSALSRAQSRIEELDARLSALTDKVDANRLAVDNITGNKPLQTQAVGSAKGSEKDAEELAPSAADFSTLDPATTDFTKAMNLFKSGKYADSELAFNHFTERFPEHILAGSAQFYAGEAYFMMGEYKLAINEYGKVLSSFSTSPRVASAMVRLSHCYGASGNKEEAARTMTLAQELYQGNPSLDWVSPAQASGRTSHESDAKSALQASPIEPPKQPQHSDDAKIDDLEEVGTH